MAKIDNFYPLYERKLAEYVDRRLNLLEIGVQDGSSIAYWKGKSDKWNVWGMDVDPHCAGEQIVIGDQLDTSLLSQFQGFDIVIDDGGHTMKQQIETFKYLFPTMPKGSVYVIEDLHTSYWPKFQDYDMTAIEFLQSLVPEVSATMINQDHRLEGQRPVNVEYNIKAMEFYPSIVFIYK